MKSLANILQIGRKLESIIHYNLFFLVLFSATLCYIYVLKRRMSEFNNFLQTEMSHTKLNIKSQNDLLGLSQEILLKWYDEMLLIRRFEEKCAQLYGMGKIGGFCHLYNGQEAIATGSVAAITPADYVITAYRDHGLAISKGLDPRRILAELLGKSTGTTKGKGGSMHLFSREKNFLGGHAIVGGHIPLAAGAAFASKYLDEKRVCLCFLGDGATNIGEFHEALNLAALWKLPVIYIIENNSTEWELPSTVPPLSMHSI